MEMPAPQDGRLADALGALASPVRLALMRALRSPKALREIEVGVADEGRPARALARQTVREHLDKLLQAGVVLARETRRGYGDTTAFAVNHQAVFALSEEMRDLARLRPVVEPEEPTLQGRPAQPLAPPRPCFVLVKGVDEGATFDLSTGSGKPVEWTVGRRRGLEVSLDYDPAVSSENARVWREGDAHWIQDKPDSRNGVRVNLRLLGKDERVRLRHGDLVGVGRSLLLYWT